MKLREIERYMKTKLKYSCKRARHLHFFPYFSSRELPLPTIIAVPHGSREIPNNVVGGIAKSLGLREADFRTSVGCQIGAACVYLCQAGFCLEFCSLQLVTDPLLHKENVKAMQVSIAVLFRETSHLMADGNVWNPNELGALRALVARLERISVSPELNTTFSELRKAIDKRATR